MEQAVSGLMITSMDYRHKCVVMCHSDKFWNEFSHALMYLYLHKYQNMRTHSRHWQVVRYLSGDVADFASYTYATSVCGSVT
jgi:hypothetical protein